MPPVPPQEPPGRQEAGDKRPPPRVPPLDWRTVFWYVAIMLLILWIWQDVFSGLAVKTIPYSLFKKYLANSQVADCEIKETEIIGHIVPPPGPGQAKASSPSGSPESTTAQPQPEAPAKSSPAKDSPPGPAEKNAQAQPEPTPPFVFRTVRVEDPKLVDELEAKGVQYTGVRPGILSSLLIAWLLPIAIISIFWLFLSRRLGSAGQAVMNFGKSRAQVSADRNTGVTFADVAGCDEAKYELQEVVDFLKNPRRYEALGAKIPKGVLLVGPPGTGKTLLARAVAGEARVPFFSLSGSEFVEMFVGVGAARVRDLFEQAKRQAPCIIFIDELDAIGRQRGVHIGAVNDEREQTLNQLLVEMDGFDPNVGVILVAATNRPDVLDRALLRPGRFDRQVVIDAPDVDGREAILKVHARGKPLADDVDLRKIAQGTVGFSGADLANALNEAALLAARRGATQIHQRDLEEAIEKLVAGPERTSRRLDAEEKRRVAYHEVGHALVAAYSKYADPVHKISIVPRGRAALGYTLQLPIAEQFLMTRSALVDRLKGLLGGRAAEETAFAEVSTGAENDLERATALARQMVCTLGMSDQVGLVHCGDRQGEFLPAVPGGPVSRDCSEETFRKIDEEVKRLLDSAYQEAKDVLRDHRQQLDRVAEELLRHESLDAAQFNALVHPPHPIERPAGASPLPLPALTPSLAERSRPPMQREEPPRPDPVRREPPAPA